MGTLLPCKRSKYLKYFIIIISILQYPYYSQLLPWIAIKGWKVGPRLEIPPEKTKHSTGETFCLLEVLANGCIHHVVTGLVVKQQYLENHDVPEEHGNQTQDGQTAQLSKPALTDRKEEQMHGQMILSLNHSWLFSSFYLNSSMTLLFLSLCPTLPLLLSCPL